MFIAGSYYVYLILQTLQEIRREMQRTNTLLERHPQMQFQSSISSWVDLDDDE